MNLQFFQRLPHRNCAQALKLFWTCLSYTQYWRTDHNKHIHIQQLSRLDCFYNFQNLNQITQHVNTPANFTIFDLTHWLHLQTMCYFSFLISRVFLKVHPIQSYKTEDNFVMLFCYLVNFSSWSNLSNYTRGKWWS